MKFKSALAALACVVASVSAVSASTVTVEFDQNGQLIGASGVEFGGQLNTVSFVEGSCVDLFDSCDAASDFQFTSSAEAREALAAIEDQVLSAAGIASTRAGFVGIAGLSDPLSGPLAISVPLFLRERGGVPNAELVAEGLLAYRNGIGEEVTGLTGLSFGTTTDTADQTSNVFAVFNAVPVAPVPLPAGGVLLLTSLGGLAAFQRRKKRDM